MLYGVPARSMQRKRLGSKINHHLSENAVSPPQTTMFSILPGTDTAVTDFIAQSGKYATAYETARNTYLAAAKNLKEETGPYKASRDAYVAATATYTKSLYE